GQYWDGQVCLQCANADLHPEGLDCSSSGTLLETLPLIQGYWRSTVDTTIIRECLNAQACLGSREMDRISSVNEYCAVGYTGPYCAVCDIDYTPGVSNSCHSCDSSFRAGMVVMLALMGVIFLGLVSLVVMDLVANPALTELNETRWAVSRWLRVIPFHKLKIPLVVFQIITQYASITAIEFPVIFRTFLSVVDVINMDAGWLLTAVCVVKINFYGRLLAATIGPLVVLLVLAGTYQFVCKRHGLHPLSRGEPDVIYPTPRHRTSSGSSDSVDEQPSVLRRVQDKHVTVALTVAFLMYSTVSTVIFQTFACDDLEEVDRSYLRADYRISCNSRRHKAYEIYAGFMILV
ncbi:unnamed protein product, partial [Sphacelaria rigidula]